MPTRHLFHHGVTFASDFEARETLYTGYSGARDHGGGPRRDRHRVRDRRGRHPELRVGQAPTDAEVPGPTLFEAADQSAVDASYQAAVAAGWDLPDEPRHWPEYAAYCAFVSDRGRNNIEACEGRSVS